MAAAEYYAPGARPPLEQQNGLYPPPQPQRANSQPTFTYHPPQQGHPSPQHPAQHSPYPPPPYQTLNHEQRPPVHFAPTPSPPGQHRPSFSNQVKPNPYSMNQFHQQGQQLAPYQQGPYISHGYPHPQQPYPPPPQRPNPAGDFGVGNGYSSDPERHRRKHKDRARRISDNSRSTNADGFLGAAGGSLIGDLIFPGLGTVGGALVGWVSGKDYGKHRKWREDKRDRDQERWERKYARSRSRSHSRDRRTSSRDRRTSSHDRRKS